MTNLTRQPGEALAVTCKRLAEDRAMDIAPAVRCALRMASDDLEQVKQQLDEAVRLLRDSLAELKPFHWALSLKGRIRAFLNNMDDRDGKGA